MAISTQIQNLNLIPGKSAPVVVHLSQGNVGNTVQFYLYDGDNPYYPTNVSIAVHGVRADNTVFGPYVVSVTSGSNLVSFDIVTAMTSVNGAAIGELVITDNNQNQIGSANFGMLVEETPYSSSVTYEDDLSIYQRILAYVQSSSASLSGQIATTNTRIDNQIATTNSQIATLNTRIDNIVAPSGGAPSAEEVVDARLGADGVTYNSLGIAIRTQFSDLKSALNDTQTLTILNNEIGQAGKYVVVDNTVADNPNYSISSPVFVKKGYQVVFIGAGAGISVSMISKYANGQYTSLVRSTDANVNKYTYTAVDDLYVAFSFNHTKTHRAYIVLPVADTFVYDVSGGNYFDAGLATLGVYISNSGREVSNSGFMVSDFIPVNVNDVIRVTKNAALVGQTIQGFDSSKQFYAHVSETDNTTFMQGTIQSGVSYIRVNFGVNDSPVITINKAYNSSLAGTSGNVVTLKEGYTYFDDNYISQNTVKNECLFKYICCIGDSLTEGEYGSDSETQESIGIHEGYPYFLSRMLYCQTENLGYGGQTAKTWWELKESKFTPEQLDFNRYDSFIIFLGTNGGVEGNPDPTEDSQMGYYCKIIDKCRTEAPGKPIFLVGFPWSVTRTSQKVLDLQRLATAENLPILDLRLSKILTYENRLVNQPFDKALHYGRLGYLRFASEISRCIREEIEKNPANYAKMID